MLRRPKYSKIEVVAPEEEEEEEILNFVRLYILQFIYLGLYYSFIATFTRACHLYLS